MLLRIVTLVKNRSGIDVQPARLARAAGVGPPWAKSRSSIVWSTGIDVPLAICAMQPMLPVATRSGEVCTIFAIFRSRSRKALPNLLTRSLCSRASFEDIQYYFHIPVAMRAETVARNDPILIVDQHASETRLRRIPIVREGKSAL